MAAHSNQWAAGHGPVAAAPVPQQQHDLYGPQMKPMGLKVQYTFDKESQVNCLARWPHILQIQTIPLDERTSIGVVDLTTCLQAVAQCSPEIVNQQELDYTVYASDYSEPDVPLVGQGMLSWGLDPNNQPQSQQLLTGRVTRNMLAIFGKGNSETLEVRLKLTPVPKMHRAEPSRGQMESQSMMRQNSRSLPPQQEPMSDTTNMEWNSFRQSNPALGRSANVYAVPSPPLSQARLENSATELRYQDAKQDNMSFQSNAPSEQRYQDYRPENMSFQQQQSRPPSVPVPPPAQQEEAPHLPQLPQLPPHPGSDAMNHDMAAQPSRPSSRSRAKVPGRGRGRPRKNPLETGNTSTAEMTDGDDQPKRKRAKVTQVDYSSTAPFAGAPDSLRVAASTSGSLRNMRPVGAAGAGPAGNHLQDVPRAPTPVPKRPGGRKKRAPAAPRRGSMAEFEPSQNQFQPPVMQPSISMMSMSQDARSPTDSIAQSPEAGYTPEQSPADLGSSPPVPRTSAYIRSSPAPSSPTLPPADSGFMSGGIDDLFEDDLAQELPKQQGQPDVLPPLPLQKPAPQRSNRRDRYSRPPTANYPFQEVTPGPVELLPVHSLFVPAGRVKTLNRQQQQQQQQQGAPPAAEGQGVLAHPARSLKRSNTAPMHTPVPRSEPEQGFQHQGEPVTQSQQLPTTRASFEVAVESIEMSDALHVTNEQVVPPAVESVAQYSPSTMQLEIGLDGKATIKTSRRPSQAQSVIDGERPTSRRASQQISQGGTPMAIVEEPQRPNPEPVADQHPTPKTEPAVPEPPVAEAVPSATEDDDVNMLIIPQEAAAPPAQEPDMSQQSKRSQEFPAPQGLQASQALQELQELQALRSLQALQAPQESEELQAPLLLPPMRPMSPRTKSLPPPPVPASDPVIQLTLPQLPQLPEMPHSEAPCPPSDMGEPRVGEPRYNKNQVKKQSIKERLEYAIEKGEMPPFCYNCGAIETPTWRKIWAQDHKGIPAFHEFSDKPGYVTCIDILERNPEGQPTLYRLVKKNLGTYDAKSDWKELLLCNPCGIWLAKCKSHRPQDRWDKDASRLGVPRRKRGSNPRNKRARTKSNGQMDPTSDAYPMTDPVGPGDHTAPYEGQDGEGESRSRRQSTQNPEAGPEQSQSSQAAMPPALLDIPEKEKRAPGSTHSRGSGTADSPIPIEEDTAPSFKPATDLGATRRLLFPSPRKDGVPKVLGELAVNIVQTAPDFAHPKSSPLASTKDKENVDLEHQLQQPPSTPFRPKDDDLDLELFGTPPVRPSTPTQKGSAGQGGPFKTPTRPTPSHRPITRSISRSIRSARSGEAAKSPSQALLALQRTPSKTPRSSAARDRNRNSSFNLNLNLLSASKMRRTPRTGGAAGGISNAHVHAHFALDEHFESPFTATMNQLLSEANEFTNGSPGRGLVDIDLSSLPNLDSDEVERLTRAAGGMDFGHFLTHDLGLPSSPPMLRSGRGVDLMAGLDMEGAGESAVAEMWARLEAGDGLGSGSGGGKEAERDV